MSLVKKLLVVAATIVGYVIVSDIVGVFASLVLDIAPVRGKTSVAFYAIWFVLGVFCGLLSFNFAASKIAGKGDLDWSNRDDVGKNGGFVLAVMVGVICLMVVGAYFFQWRYGSDGDFFVPDNEPLTITFFVAVLGAAVAGHTVLRPTKTTTKPGA